jgi:hypothetical protein
MSAQKFLKDLEKGRCGHNIIVRVLRKWTHHENLGDGPPLFIGMVLADAKVFSSFCYRTNRYSYIRYCFSACIKSI